MHTENSRNGWFNHQTEENEFRQQERRLEYYKEQLKISERTGNAQDIKLYRECVRNQQHRVTYFFD